MDVPGLCLSSGSDCCGLSFVGEIGLLSSLVSCFWCLMFVLVPLSVFIAAYNLYLYSYSQRGSIYSGLYFCSWDVFVNFCCYFSVGFH